MRSVLAAVAIAGVVLGAGCAPQKKQPAASEKPHVVAKTPEDAGRYLVSVGSCNDCHTAGYTQQGEAIPETARLTGNPIGDRGPWGVTYASNLRLFVAERTEEQWVAEMRERNAKPPMPWTALHAMEDGDLKAVYLYIKSLGPAGEKTPDYVPPDQQPTTPVVNYMPVMPDGSPMPMPEGGAAPGGAPAPEGGAAPSGQ